jgi:hypothetical protein
MKYLLTIIALTVLAASSAFAQSTQMSVQEIEPLFQNASAETGVDVRLLRVVAWIESRYKPRAVSYKNGRPCAYGLMQLIPATAARFGVNDPFDPLQNVLGGARYLKYLHKMFNGDVSLMLASYNAGEGAVLKYGRNVPPYRETINYVSSGRALLARSGMPVIYQPAPALAPPVAPASTTVQVAELARPVAPPPTSSFVRRPAAQTTVEQKTSEQAESSVKPVSFVRRAPLRLL